MKKLSSKPKKPPVPSDSHAEVAAWLKSGMPGLQPILKHLDKTIRETIPGLQYAVKWKKAYYGLPDKGWLIELAAYDVSANVVFFGGAKFDPPPPLGEGSRYVKVRSLDEARAPEILDWVKQARRGTGWR